MTQLQYLQDIIDLEIKSVNDMPKRKRERYLRIEQRVKRRYKAPSLPAYLLYEYQFNNQKISSLSRKLRLSYSRTYNLMCFLGVPTRNILEANRINKINNRLVLEQRVREQYGMSLYRYINKRHHKNDYSIRDMAKEIGATYQTIHNIMKALGIEIRTREEAIAVRAKKIQKNKKKKARKKGK